ncbi:MAG: lipid A biosynthesis acyltransferase [Flavobacteriaceae bacterium]|nr:lipid A biosynthesis acyltransferase [Flavobacteriaceae bacterium]
MATEWEGKSKGTVLGYRIFVFFIKKLGLRAAYSLLFFVALYYCIFSPKSTRSIYYYLRHRKRYSLLKSIISVFRNYYVFGQTIIDKTAISSGMRDRFTYEFDGVENIMQLLESGEGGILISAHVGNFELAQFFFDELDAKSQINLVTTDAEHREIKEYFEKVTQKSNIKFILIEDDMSHIFKISEVLGKGELVCFTGDRYFEGSKSLSHNLLGAEAKFPAGPFQIASRLQKSVAFVYVMKETTTHYHLFARTTQVPRRDAQLLLERYVASVESMLEKYPLQWFNYFNFWNEQKEG